MKGLGGLLLLAFFLLIFSFRQVISLYSDWLWFQEVGYTQVFTSTLLYKLILGLIGGGVFFALVYANVKIAARAPRGIRFLRADNVIELPSPELVDPLLQRLLLPGALLLGLFAAPPAAGHWETFLLSLNSFSFGLQEPLFSRDISFFVFQLPALWLVYYWSIAAVGLSLLITAFVYLLYRGIQYGSQGLFLSRRAKTHLLILIAVLLALKAGGYVLEGYDLVYSARGAA